MAKPISVCILGSPGAGKSTFLGGLELLNEPNRRSRIVVKAEGEARRLMLEYAATLRKGSWPPATTKMTMVPCTVTTLGTISTVLKLQLLDYPGNLMDSLNIMDRATMKELDDIYQSANFLLLLLDPDLDVAPVAANTVESTQQRNDRLGALLTAVTDKWLRMKDGDVASTTPDRQHEIAIVITKADTRPELFVSGVARRFIATHLPGFLEKVLSLSPSAGFFALSAIGELAPPMTPGGVRIPCKDRLAPKGYNELLHWIYRQRNPRNWNLIAGVSASTLACAICFWLFLLPAPHPPSPPLPPSSDIVAEFENSISIASTEEVLKELSGKLKRLKATYPVQFTNNIFDKLNANIITKHEYFGYQEVIKSGYNKYLADVFLTKYPKSQYVSDVRAGMARQYDKEYANSRKLVALSMAVPGKKLRDMIVEVASFKEQWKDKLTDSEKGGLGEAITFAKELDQIKSVWLRILQSGTYDRDRFHHLRFHSDGIEVFNETYRGKSGMSVQWNKEIDFAWKAGQPIHIELFVNHNWYSFSSPASATQAGIDAIYRLFDAYPCGTYYLQQSEPKDKPYKFDPVWGPWVILEPIGWSNDGAAWHNLSIDKARLSVFRSYFVTGEGWK